MFRSAPTLSVVEDCLVAHPPERVSPGVDRAAQRTADTRERQLAPRHAVPETCREAKLMVTEVLDDVSTRTRDAITLEEERDCSADLFVGIHHEAVPLVD